MSQKVCSVRKIKRATEERQALIGDLGWSREYVLKHVIIVLLPTMM